MRVLVLGAQKGGAGKSMIAMSLAVAALQAGERVAGLDIDPQRSFQKWGERRGNDNLVVRSMVAGEVETMLGRAQRNGFTLAIIDTPGRIDASVTHTLRRANFVLVPCRPSLMDIEACDELVGILRPLGRPFGFVLSQTDGRTPARTQEARELLEQLGTVAPGSIGWRASFQDALQMGVGATELGGPGEVEIDALWQWTRDRLAA